MCFSAGLKKERVGENVNLNDLCLANRSKVNY